MNIFETWRQLQKKESIQPGYRFVFADKADTVLTRIKKLEKIVKGKRVIHLGCADHQALIPRKIKAGKWLHKKLTDVASRCVGIDIDQECITYIRDTLGYDNVYCSDLLHDALPIALDGHWDYILLGEVLEHIDNPVSFLQAIRTKLMHRVDNIIITVPNSLWLNNIISGLRHEEFINSDHRFWFSPYTLSKVASQGGFSPEELHFCMNGDIRAYAWWKRYILKHYPIFREDIILVARCESMTREC